MCSLLVNLLSQVCRISFVVLGFNWKRSICYFHSAYVSCDFEVGWRAP